MMQTYKGGLMEILRVSIFVSAFLQAILFDFSRFFYTIRRNILFSINFLCIDLIPADNLIHPISDKKSPSPDGLRIVAITVVLSSSICATVTESLRPSSILRTIRPHGRSPIRFGANMSSNLQELSELVQRVRPMTNS